MIPAIPDCMTPADMRLRFYPDPLLFQNGEPISRFDAALQANVERLFEIMYENSGIGLAAHQVGWPVRLFVCAIPQEPDPSAQSLEAVEAQQDSEQIIDEYVFINPEFVAHSREQSDFEEGCLSFPDIRAVIKRPVAVTVTAYDLTGQAFTLEADGLLARCMQHEYDHITGQLFHRLWSPAARSTLQGKLKELRDEFEMRKSTD